MLFAAGSIDLERPLPRPRRIDMHVARRDHAQVEAHTDLRLGKIRLPLKPIGYSISATWGATLTVQNDRGKSPRDRFRRTFDTHWLDQTSQAGPTRAKENRDYGVAFAAR